MDTCITYFSFQILVLKIDKKIVKKIFSIEKNVPTDTLVYFIISLFFLGKM